MLVYNNYKDDLLCNFSAEIKNIDCINCKKI